MNYLIFDVETIPDLDYGRRFLNLDGLDNEDIGRAMFFQQQQKTGKEFLPLYLQKVISISVLTDAEDALELKSLAGNGDNEKLIIQSFYNTLEEEDYCLVTWNGLLFDLPVLNYRALFNQVDASSYWQKESWHIDVKDSLSDHHPIGQGNLDEVSKGLGFPGKINLQGNQVWDSYLEGNREGISNYCDFDVFNTYLVFLKYQAMIGKLSEDQLSSKLKQFRIMLKDTDEKHFEVFLKRWEEQS